MPRARHGDIGREPALADHEAAILAHPAVGRDETERRGGRTHSCALMAGPRLVEAAHAVGRERDRLDDLRVAGAAADVAGDGVDDLGARGRRVVGQQRMGGEDHRRRAVPALHAVGLAERVLDGRELARAGRHPLDGGDLYAVGLHGEHQAGAHGHAVDQHGAGAAHAVLAAGMGAGEPEPVAQAIEQAGARLDLDRVQAPVDGKLNPHARPAPVLMCGHP